MAGAMPLAADEERNKKTVPKRRKGRLFRERYPINDTQMGFFSFRERERKEKEKKNGGRAFPSLLFILSFLSIQQQWRRRASIYLRGRPRAHIPRKLPNPFLLLLLLLRERVNI